MSMTALLPSTRQWITSVVFFFFFQAEDGIRDKLVTGVQTCALPISPEAHPVIVTAPGEEAQVDYGDGPMVRHPGTGRSEERRVGKSVDLGGRRIIKKKKKKKRMQKKTEKKK